MHDVRRAVVDDYVAHVAESAARHGLEPLQVRALVRRYERKAGLDDLPRPRRMLGKDHTHVIAAYRRHLNFRAAGREVGLSSQRVNQIVLRHEAITGEVLPRRKVGHPRNIDHDAVVAVYRAGQAARQVAAQFGCSHSYVLQLVGAYERQTGEKIPRRRRGPAPRRAAA